MCNQSFTLLNSKLFNFICSYILTMNIIPINKAGNRSQFSVYLIVAVYIWLKQKKKRDTKRLKIYKKSYFKNHKVLLSLLTLRNYFIVATTL